MACESMDVDVERLGLRARLDDQALNPKPNNVVRNLHELSPEGAEPLKQFLSDASWTIPLTII